jgi:hypothetical protein
VNSVSSISFNCCSRACPLGVVGKVVGNRVGFSRGRSSVIKSAVITSKIKLRHEKHDSDVNLRNINVASTNFLACSAQPSSRPPDVMSHRHFGTTTPEGNVEHDWRKEILASEYFQTDMRPTSSQETVQIRAIGSRSGLRGREISRMQLHPIAHHMATSYAVGTDNKSTYLPTPWLYTLKDVGGIRLRLARKLVIT